MILQSNLAITNAHIMKNLYKKISFKFFIDKNNFILNGADKEFCQFRIELFRSFQRLLFSMVILNRLILTAIRY